MNWKVYQNELLVLLSLFIMLGAYLYKSSAVETLESSKSEIALSMAEVGSIIALKKQWDNPELEKQIKKIHKKIGESKVKAFNVRGKKLTASFQDLSDKEMNKIVVALENIAIQIVSLNIKREDQNYKMEIKCKW